MQPYHKEIREKRAERRNQSNGSNTRTRSNDRSVMNLKRNKKKLQALNVRIASAKLILKDLSVDEDNESGGAEDSNAGNAFGGSDEKSSKKRRS